MLAAIPILLVITAQSSAFNSPLVSLQKINLAKSLQGRYIVPENPNTVEKYKNQNLYSSRFQDVHRQMRRNSNHMPKMNLNTFVSESSDESDQEQTGPVRIYVRTEDIDVDLTSGVKEDAGSLITSALFHESEPSDTELSIVLCSDNFIQKLNKQWRGKDKATDVLSFPQEDDSDVVLGDLVISIPTAIRQV